MMATGTSGRGRWGCLRRKAPYSSSAAATGDKVEFGPRRMSTPSTCIELRDWNSVFFITHRDGVGAGHVRDEKMAGVEGGVQALHAAVDWAPPQAEVDAPVAAVPGAAVKHLGGKQSGGLMGRGQLY